MTLIKTRNGTTHAPRPNEGRRPWTLCGLPKQGQKRTGELVETEGVTPSCGLCRNIVWHRARRGDS